MSNIAIKVDNLHKAFKLPHEKQSSIKGVLINAFKKRTYERQQVLNGITFEIKQGEFFGIVGRNGSGKSTLLKLLAGIYSPEKGGVRVNGNLTPFIELGVGFNHELTGRENIYLNGALLGFSRNEMDEMYDDIVTFAELDRFMDQKLKNYSSGMQVRLAFSIAIRADSDILLMDEVLAVGDSAFQKKCFDVFKDLKEKGRTIVLVTHDMASVERFCDRALVLDRGEIVDIGDSHRIAATYARLNIEDSLDNASDSGKIKDSRKWGTGGVTIKSITFLDKNNKKVKIFSNNEEFKLSILLNRAEKFKDTEIVCGISIVNQDGINIAGPNTANSSLDPKKSEFIFSIPKLSLSPGNYKLSVAIFNIDQTSPYDFHDRVYEFSIISDHVVHGVVELQGDKWISK